MSDSATLITDPGSISAYNRGSLLTPFTPPASCLSVLTAAVGGAPLYFGHFGPNYVDPACYPSSTTTAGIGTSAWDIYYYSPGVCPLGWSQAQTLTSSFGRWTGGDGISSALSIGPDTTAVVCCPSGWLYSALGHLCAITWDFDPSGYTTIPYIKPSRSGNQWISTNANAPLSTTISQGTVALSGDGIPIWWQESDSQIFAEASSTASKTSTASSSTKSTSLLPAQSSNLTSPSNTSSHSGLSTGAKIAIGLVIPLFAIALAAAVAIYFPRKHKRKRSEKTESMAAMMDDAIKLPDRTTELGTQGAVLELYSDAPQRFSQNATPAAGAMTSPHSPNNNLGELAG